MSLADYLAKNYLTADSSTSDPSRPKKKRKKNHASEPAAGLVIADDDAELSISHASSALLNEDPDGPLVYGGDSRGGSGRSAEFRKKRASGWKTIGDTSAIDSTANKRVDAGAEEADSILLAAAREQESRRLDAEEGDAPTVVEDTRPQFSGGLQTAAETRAIDEARNALETAERKSKKKKSKEEREAQQEETVYRDATGRRIDIHLKRAEARKAEEAARRKEQEEQEKLTGDVQRERREQRKQELDDAKFLKVARYADDEDLNNELRGQERWGDTMAGYIAKEVTTEGTTKSSGKPMYKGSFQPNRYGIRPGHRWDGVDRGNGFERQWFQARSRKDRTRDLEYQWQMDE